MSEDILSDHQEKSCILCFKIAALYNRRENLIKDNAAQLGMKLDIPIMVLLDDLKQWMLKNE